MYGILQLDLALCTHLIPMPTVMPPLPDLPPSCCRSFCGLTASLCCRRAPLWRNSLVPSKPLVFTFMRRRSLRHLASATSASIALIWYSSSCLLRGLSTASSPSNARHLSTDAAWAFSTRSRASCALPISATFSLHFCNCSSVKESFSFEHSKTSRSSRMCTGKNDGNCEGERKDKDRSCWFDD